MTTLSRWVDEAVRPCVVIALLVSCLTAQVVKTTAGGFVGNGGSATKASLDWPIHVAQDKSGNLYISEIAGQRIRKVTPTGTISTFAGTGIAGFSGDGGLATAAQLNYPSGLAFDSVGNLILADEGNNRIRSISPAGIITTIAGTGVAGYSGDGSSALLATFNAPWALTYDRKGDLYISDFNNCVVRVVNTAGIINTFAGNGTAGYSGDGGPATSASLNFPRGLVFDTSGDLYIADFLNHAVREVNTLGIISTFAGNGQAGFSGDGGPAISASIGNPRGLAFRNGTLYIGNAGRARIRSVPLSTGIINTYAGSTYGYDGDGNPLLSTMFADPNGLLFDPSGRLIVVDTQNQRVRRVAGTVMKTIAGGFIGDGKRATAASLVLPEALAFDKSGNYYTADATGNRIRKVNSAGEISTIAGTGVSGYSGDGGLATSAQLYLPLGVALDSTGNIFIADDGNNVIRKIDTTGIISTFATDANFSGLGTIAVDPANNLYVVDQGTCVLWKVSPAAVVTLVAGVEFVCGYNGDNISATTAQLNSPVGVALDRFGNIFVADYGNNRVRKINPGGTITTFAGDGTCGFLGDGGPPTSAELCFPEGVAITSGGTVYIADTGNVRIRKVAANIISTYAGTGFAGYNGDGLAALSTNLDDPVAVTLNSSGIVYVVDDVQNRVRRIH